MKAPLILCIVVLAAALGYLLEPSLRSTLTGSSTKTPQENTSEVEEVIMLEDPPIDISAYAPEQLPKVLKLKQPAQFKDKSSGLTIAMPVGSTAKLLRVDGKTAVVSPGETSYKILIPISKTDLMDQLANVTPKASGAAPATATETAPPAESDNDTTANTTPEAAPTEAPPTETPPAASTPTEPAPTPEPAASTEPSPAPTPAPTVGSGPSSDVVAVMKNSILAAEIKEFTSQQVTEWKADAAETVEGQSFQTGVVTYQAESPFGKKAIQAKAYIQNGKVVRWIWPNSGIQLK